MSRPRTCSLFPYVPEQCTVSANRLLGQPPVVALPLAYPNDE